MEYVANPFADAEKFIREHPEFIAILRAELCPKQPPFTVDHTASPSDPAPAPVGTTDNGGPTPETT